MSFRIGQGVDTHQLVEGYELIIGGVSVPFEKGSKGHSDGDVLLHAIVDALLGAVSMGDIGQHFPSSDDQWKDANSSKFLSHTNSLVLDAGYKIQNIDATVTLQEPHISDYIPQMKTNIATILQIDEGSVSVKATTSDHLGYCGRGEGISATAITLVSKENSE
ncbi:MAG: 2-C-methyl-D-erythritol 2,4-cyclodiphosphate synthase [Candidatus Marinimicrobia bacterium]|nr:2-C-methyl-D-erythritol 2,4-cyclodiphosphate synthase [Candidatus Neomarinimicrobiota bacterium]